MHSTYSGVIFHASAQCLVLSIFASFAVAGAHQVIAVATPDRQRVTRTMRSASDLAVSISGKGAVLQPTVDWSIGGDSSQDDVHSEEPQTDQTPHEPDDPVVRCNQATTPHDISLISCPNPVLTTPTRGSNSNLYNEVKASVLARYDSLSSVCVSTDCERADFGGAVLRMAGHDFMDFNADDGTGGSDGCIDFNDPDNGGLKQTLCGEGEFSKGATLNAVYSQFCERVSYADFVVIAAESVMIRSRPDYSSATHTSPTLSFDFVFGRTTATSCPKVRGKTDLPNPEHGCNAVDEVFNKRMGLHSWRASAALMGVHTLGRMRMENSGYEGWWNEASGGRLFDNDYYQAMTTGWKAKRAIGGNPNKNGWMRADSGPSSDLFLDTDLCLYQGGSDVFAKTTSDACQWSVIKDGPTSNHNFCLLPGGQRDTSRFPSQGCCGLPSDDSDQARLQPDTRADFFDTHEGPAGQDVMDFAENENAWLEEFTKAWAHVTENNLNWKAGSSATTTTPDSTPWPMKDSNADTKGVSQNDEEDPEVCVGTHCAPLKQVGAACFILLMMCCGVCCCCCWCRSVKKSAQRAKQTTERWSDDY